MSWRGAPGLLPPIRWEPDALEADRKLAIANFRRERLDEPVEDYRAQFDAMREIIADVMARTDDLVRLEESALALLSHPDTRLVFRYLAGPPISEDDLKTLGDTNSLAPGTLTSDPALVQRLLTTVSAALDRRRFPWIAEHRYPTGVEREGAILATAALAATRAVETNRRTQGKSAQETAVREALLGAGFVEVTLPNQGAPTLAQAPHPGEFSREASLAGRKADLIVGLWDHRVMPIECKVSNSSINSIKRLNNDAAAKAESWLTDLGQLQIVPVAVLGGVYGLHSLESAQRRGLTLYWAHRLSDLTDWIAQTRSHLRSD